MDGTSEDVIYQKCDATHAQRLSGESAEFVRSKMVHKEIAAHEIERIVGEGQSERIPSHSAGAAVQVAAGSVEKGNGQVKIWGKTLSDFGRNKARSGGDFQKRSALTATFRQRSADKFLGCPDAAEPLVEHLQIAKGAGDFARSSCVEVQ
jgi:hypothetical protein